MTASCRCTTLWSRRPPMGKEVVYCFNCGVRLLRADFERGAAHRAGTEYTCADCLPVLLELLPPKERAEFQKNRGKPDPAVKTSGPRRGTGRVPTADKPTRKITSTRLRAKPQPEEDEEGPVSRRVGRQKKKSKLPLVFAGLGGLIALMIVLLVLATRGKGPKSAPEEETSSGAKPPPAAPAPPEKSLTAEDLARMALEKARKYQADHPKDREGQLIEFAGVARKYGKTAAGTEALKEAEALQKKIESGLTPEMEALLGKIKEPREREEYKKVIDLLYEAKEKDPTPAWILQVDRQIDQVRAETDRRFKELKQKAEEARGKGEKEEIDGIRKQVAKWGIQKYAEEFDAAFPAPPVTDTAAAPAQPGGGETARPATPAAPEGPKRNEEGKAYLDRWTEAVRPATSRDYAAAIGRVEQAGQNLQEDEWKREAEEDLRDLRDVEAFLKAAMKAAAFSPGQPVSLEILTPSGGKETIEGVIVVADEDHLEIKREGQKSFTIVDPSELAAPSLARAVQESGRGWNGRAAVLFLLLEGEAEAAKQLGTGGIPDKYWEYAKDARDKAPRLDSGEARREREAKILYYGAAREFAKVETMGAAIDKYKMLARDYVGTSIVTRNIKLVTLRSEAGKDYVLAHRDIKGSGLVKPGKHPELGPCWTCKEDVTQASQALETYVEFEFHALQETEYRCWLYAGACCQETFIVYMQATDMTGPNPNKRSEQIPYDVGGNIAAPVDPKLRNLKRTHAQHGGEKEPSRWDWMTIPLPKYAAAGPKKVRLMVEHKGFSALVAVVTSVRKSPPKDEELGEELKRAAAEAKERPAEVTMEAGLVGRWKLDDSGGGQARDASGQGNNGKIKGNPKAVAGKVGGALEFDGNGDVIEIAGNAALKKLQSGSFTIAAWFRPKDKPPGADKDNKAAYGIVNKPGCHEGIKYTNDKKFMVEHWLTDAGGKDFQVNHGTWADTFEPGSWYHVVCVVDTSSRTITIYVNGKARGSSKPWDAGAKARDYGNAPWRIGCANPGAKEYAWPAKATFDDVRLYSRALGAKEVENLYGAGMAGLDK